MISSNTSKNPSHLWIPPVEESVTPIFQYPHTVAILSPSQACHTWPFWHIRQPCKLVGWVLTLLKNCHLNVKNRHFFKNKIVKNCHFSKTLPMVIFGKRPFSAFFWKKCRFCQIFWQSSRGLRVECGCDWPLMCSSVWDTSVQRHLTDNSDRLRMTSLWNVLVWRFLTDSSHLTCMVPRVPPNWSSLTPKCIDNWFKWNFPSWNVGWLQELYLLTM